MIPSIKTETMEKTIKEILGFDRQKTIQENRCAPPPYGCEQVVKEEDFVDEISRKEFGISGLCQTCQNKVFSVD